jgi:hypothetical protein
MDLGLIGGTAASISAFQPMRPQFERHTARAASAEWRAKREQEILAAS